MDKLYNLYVIEWPPGFPKALSDRETTFLREQRMPSANLGCPSCKRTNVEGSRYCIHCGAILKPIYCSSCGTKNPDGLEQCLECGSSLPTLAEVRWNPIVTVIKPTSAMVEEKQGAPAPEAKPMFRWLHSKIVRTKTRSESKESS